MKDIYLLHDSAWPHTSLCTCEVVTKIEWTVCPHPAHSPDLAPSDYHLFGPVKDAVCGFHFSDDNKLKQSFCDVLRSGGREFYNTGTQCLTRCWQKCVENAGDFVENSLIDAKDI
jgi:histone-lysine N-methyltransferase SETMAR